MTEVRKVIDLLTKIYEIHVEICDVSKAKREQIIAGDAEALSETVKQEWALLAKVARIEEERHALTVEICGKEDATIYDVAQLANTAQKEELEKITKELRDVLEEQKQLNDENKSLIELHLEYMDFMVNNFAKPPQVSNMYGNSGAAVDDETTNKGIIDNQA